MRFLDLSSHLFLIFFADPAIFDAIGERMNIIGALEQPLHA